jgi:hypothetical protein
MEWSVFHLVFWLIAGIVSFYFSLGNARVWTSIALGFFLILVGEIIPQTIPLLPGVEIPYIMAMSMVIGTIAILLLSHGFQEYYVFSRTLELEGKRLHVYLATGAVIVASFIFLLINPTPAERTLEVIRIVENANWVFLSLINIDLIRKIYFNVQDSPISRGFLAFLVAFVFIVLWKGSELYIHVYALHDLALEYPFRYHLSLLVNNVGSVLASITIGGTFLYLARVLR